LVWTEKGLQRIELIKEGDRVFAYDTESKKVVSKKVLTAYTREVSRLIKLEYGNEIIFTTSEHPFYVNNIWVEASKLKAGDFVFLHDESTLPVLKITVIDSVVKVYNFTVEDVHNYYVGKNKVLVHNNNPCAQVFKTVTSLVKTNSKMLQLARETFKGNSLLNKEANNLISQLIRGNMNPGIGTKIIGKEIFEARSRNGARVYFRNGANNIIEILGYSNKANQQTVIDLLLKIY
ncbi:MAG: polymorphic toxin-type HINT domain-containing protein, partial [Bacteroidia bacterium]|nr:polymorphic toxin-type HINT domain-containing protein [Bacteroidia bacterium]